MKIFISRIAVRVGAAFLLSVFVAGGIAAGQGSDWRAHTPMRQVTAIDVADGSVWIATLGGVFSYSTSTGEIQRYTTVQGLHGIDARALAVDDTGASVWIGYGDGVLDRLEMDTGEVASYLDIARADQYQSRGIVHLESMGDSLLALTDFGVVVFDVPSAEVRDAYTRIGTWPPAIPVQDVLIVSTDTEREIWLASSRGVASAALDDRNLQEPTSWTVEPGIQDRATNALAVFNEKLFAATTTDVLKREDALTWSGVGLSGNEVFDISATSEWLVAVEEFSLVTLDRNGAGTRQFLFREGPLGDPVQYLFPRHLRVAQDGVYWIGDEREGLVGVKDPEKLGENITETIPIVPDGPQNGLFTDIVSDPTGGIWVAGSPGNGTGFHRLSDGEWTDYTARSRRELEGRASYDHIHAGPLGNIWAGSVGKGIARVAPDGTLTVYDHDNSSLRPAAGTDDFVRVRGLATESDGTLWAINEFSPFPLVIWSATGEWSSIAPVRAPGAPPSLSYRQIHIDTFGQKWILCDRTQGLLVFDSGEDPADSGDDKSRYIRGMGAGGVGLPNETVTAWAQDGFGNVWIGTERGIAFFSTPSLVLFDDPAAAQAQWPITELDSGERAFLLRDLFVNDLFVDAANNLWIASKTGVWMLELTSVGGAEIRSHYTTDNSPLFSDDVVAIGADDRKGRVYFATNKGMLSVQGDAVSPSPELQALSIFPNPARVGPGFANRITIEGLVSETDVKILTVSGRIIKSMEGRGGRMVWDGRTDEGKPAPSAVYIVAAVGRNGEGTVYGKIALIR